MEVNWRARPAQMLSELEPGDTFALELTFAGQQSEVLMLLDPESKDLVTEDGRVSCVSLFSGRVFSVPTTEPIFEVNGSFEARK